MPERWRTAALVGAASTLVGFAVLTEWDTNEHGSIPARLLGALVIWGILTPLTMLLAARLPVAAPHRAIRLAILTVAGLAVAVLQSAFDVLTPIVLGGEAGVTRAEFLDIIAANADVHFLVFAGVVAAVNGARLRRAALERERRESEIAAALHEAQLQRLGSDLNPHFLFNSLNAVTTLIHTDPPAARATLRKLTELLRYSFDAVAQPAVPLRKELEFAQLYLDLQKLRFGERLRTQVDVEPRLLDAAVPPFLLQPLIENSIVHGIARNAAGGSVRVRAGADDGMVCIEVRDDGRGFDPQSPQRRGIGLSHTEKRLEVLFAGAHPLRFRHDGDEFIAEIRIPLA